MASYEDKRVDELLDIFFASMVIKDGSHTEEEARKAFHELIAYAS